MTNDRTVASRKVTPARPARSRPVGLVASLFGLSGRTELPGLGLVRLLGDLGHGESAARGLLARMRREGQLRAVRRGRESGYRLDGPFLATFERLRTPPPPPPWAGRFHALLHQIPEEHRAYRDRLRRMATFAGYGVMQPGVLVAVRDRTAAIAPVVAEAPPGCRLHHAELGMDTADAAAVAAVAWDLDALAVRLRGHVDLLTAALERAAAPDPSADTLRRLVALTNAPTVDLIDDPGLPIVLRPDGWPGPDLADRLDRVRRRDGPPAAAYVHRVLDGR